MRARQCELAQRAPERRTKIMLIAQMQIPDFDERQQAWLQHALAGFLRIPPDAVVVKSVEE